MPAIKPKRGRPPSKDGRGRGSPCLYVRVSDDERGKIEAYCERNGWTVSELVRIRLADIISPPSFL